MYATHKNTIAEEEEEEEEEEGKEDDDGERKKEGNALFNDALNTFHLRLYGVRHMVKNHSWASFICIIPQTG